MLHGVLAHVDVRMDISLDHGLNIGWLLVQELLIPHDSSVVNNDAGPLTCIKQLSISAWSSLCHIKLHNLSLDHRIESLGLFRNFLELIYRSGANFDVVA